MRLLNDDTIEVVSYVKLPKVRKQVYGRMTLHKKNCTVSEYYTSKGVFSKSLCVIFDSNTNRAYKVKGSYDTAVKLILEDRRPVKIIGFGKT